MFFESSAMLKKFSCSGMNENEFMFYVNECLEVKSNMKNAIILRCNLCAIDDVFKIFSDEVHQKLCVGSLGLISNINSINSEILLTYSVFKTNNDLNNYGA